MSTPDTNSNYSKTTFKVEGTRFVGKCGVEKAINMSIKTCVNT